MKVLGKAEVNAIYLHRDRFDVFRRTLKHLQERVLAEDGQLDPINDYIKIEYIRPGRSLKGGK